MSKQWNKGYKMGYYLYTYGDPGVRRPAGECPERERDTGAFTKEEAAYWKAYFSKKYQGKF